MQNQPELIILPDTTAIAHAVAGRVLTQAQQRVAETGRCVLVLAGGSTPQALYRRLAQEPLRSQMPWQQMHVLWGDERYVPPDDPASNYRRACDALLAHVPIPEEQIYPVPTGHTDPREAALAYDRQVRAILADNQGRLDLVLLGMGPDGHIASLFPESPALEVPEEQFAVAVADAPRPPSVRISLTAQAFNRAACVLFMVTGASKAAALHDVLHGPYLPRQLPARLVRPPGGTVTWLVDEGAAGAAEES